MVRVKKKAALQAAENEGKEDVVKNLLEGRDVLSQLGEGNETRLSFLRWDH